MHVDLSLGRRSGWIFETSNGGGVSVGFVGAERGTFTLRTPDKQSMKFAFSAMGLGVSTPLKLKVGKVRLPVTTAGSSEEFKSWGLVFMTRQFQGPELAIGNIRGACLFVELNASLVWGGSAYAMMFGMNPTLLATTMLAGMAGPTQLSMIVSLADRAIASATGFLIFGGLNFGIQAGGGLTGFAGYVHPLNAG